MYIRYFGLSENPFAISPDPRYLYLSRRHQEALAHLTFGITQGGGFVQLTGEVGTGKTMMIRTLLERLPENVDVALVLYPFLSVHEFLAAICTDLRVPNTKEGDSIKVSIDALNGYLLENHARGRRTVLIIDEAQKLSHDILEQIRLLTNLETTKEKLLQILLIGQPELNHLLAQQNLRQLAQRITARYALQPLSLSETREYIAHRLQVAGAHANFFSEGAMHWIHRASGGIPRVVNVICDRALLGAYASGKTTVQVGLARRAAAEVGNPQRRAWRRPALAAGIMALAAALGWGGWQVAPPFIQAMNAAPATAAVAATAATPDPVTKVAATPVSVAPAPESVPPTLVALLADGATRSDTVTAFQQLFARWQLDYTAFQGDTACERAEQAGLRCVLTTGTWNSLRQYDRPTVLELVDGAGNRHHVLLSRLSDDKATLDFGGTAHTLPIVDIDRFWFGKSLFLWQPPINENVLKRGMRGASVRWLRTALARSEQRELAPERASDTFDVELEQQVKAFQRRHQLPTDGVVGELTLLRLKSDDPSLTASGIKTAAAR